MQTTSALYREIISNPAHWFEVSVVIGDSGRLVAETAQYITVGGVKILVETNSPDTGFREGQLISMSTTQRLLTESADVGNVIAGEIDLQMLSPTVAFPRMALIKPYVRATDGSKSSEWLPKGLFYIDTRYISHNSDGLDVITIHGYDAMLKAEKSYPSDTKHNYPLLDKSMAAFIAESIGIQLDARTATIMNKGYKFNLPIGYSMREVLSMIGIAYGGNWYITDEGLLRMVAIYDVPKETRYLVDTAGYALRFGGDHIIV